MKKTVADLIMELESNPEINYTITQLAMVLEMNTYMLYGTLSESQMEAYEYCLDEELLSVRLSVEEQKEIVDKLVDLVFLLQSKDGTAFENSATVLWAIGKACMEVGLSGIVRVIKYGLKELDDKSSYQAIIALDNYVIYCKENNCDERLLNLDFELLDFLVDKSKSHNEELSESAKRVMKKINTRI